MRQDEIATCDITMVTHDASRDSVIPLRALR